MKRGPVVIALVIIAAGATVGILRSRPEPSRAKNVETRGRPVPGVRIRLEVLNAGGVSGMAGDATAVLREQGFDVVFLGNAEASSEDISSVIDRVGDMRIAAAVANALGIRNVLSEPDSNLFVDASVMLGSEWHPPEAVLDKPAGVRAWWNPRSWF